MLIIITVIIFARFIPNYLLSHNKYFVELLAQNKSLLALNFDAIT